MNQRTRAEKSAEQAALHAQKRGSRTLWETLPRPIAALAPMEDVTDTVFRRIVASCGRPDVFFTEFTSADGLCSPAGHDAVAHRLEYTEEERPLIAQIWGIHPETHREAAGQAVELGFDGIDINMGCPVKKIVKTGACSALIQNPSLAREIYLATCEGAGDLPVSIKTRCGFKSWVTEDWTGFLLELAPAVLTVHGRIARDESKFPADWEQIGRVAALRDQMKSPTLILGNGDVHSLDDMEEKVGRYGLDGVMVGRGILHDPFLFRDAADHPWPEGERLDLLLEHLSLYQETWGERKFYGRLKKFYKMYVSSFPGASHLRTQMMETESIPQARELIRAWRESHPPA
jgi:tRNA-dihydrouridine synthase